MSEKKIQQLETEAEAARQDWAGADRRSSVARDEMLARWHTYTAAVAKLKQAKKEGVTG